MPTMEIIAEVVNGRVLGSKPADPLGGRVPQRGPADEWPSMPPPTCHRRTARGSPHPRTPALRHPGRPRAQFRQQQKRCRLDVTLLTPGALLKCERRTSDTNYLQGASHRRALERAPHSAQGRACLTCAHFSLHQRFIAPGGHLVTDGSEFRGGQHAARYRKQLLVFNGDVPAV